MNKGMSLNSKFSEVDSLDMTLSHTTENGDIFNENADEDYSKILDYGKACPPNCTDNALMNCDAN